MSNLKRVGFKEATKIIKEAQGDVEFHNCDLSGIEFYGINKYNVYFVECDLRYCSFADDCDVDKLNFVDCRLH